jgi:hypothetical protein
MGVPDLGDGSEGLAEGWSAEVTLGLASAGSVSTSSGSSVSELYSESRPSR